MKLLRLLWSWLLRQIPSDQDMEAAERDRREKALRDFHNRRESDRQQRQAGRQA